MRIAPHLGNLPSLTADFPHPDGNIHVNYVRNGANLDATIELPGKLAGTFVLGGKSQQLKPGTNHITASLPAGNQQ